MFHFLNPLAINSDTFVLAREAYNTDLPAVLIPEWMPVSESPRYISLRGVEVHNLKRVNLDIPRRKLVALCGLSGSGKTSLALDTLYAEGQRRYIESFSAYTRQFFERLEKPAADKISGIPPAIAVTHKNASRSNRATVGTVTEANDHLRLLLARIGTVVCQTCGSVVRRESPESVADKLSELPAGTRYLLAFESPPAGTPEGYAESLAMLRGEGFVRIIRSGMIINLDDTPSEPEAALPVAELSLPIIVVVDRLTAGTTAPQRLRDSLETAFNRGGGKCLAFVERSSPADAQTLPRGEMVSLDDREWTRLAFSRRMICDGCGREYPTPEPRLYSFNSPLGACPECEGFGNKVGHRHGIGGPGYDENAPRGRDRSLEYPRLFP